MLWLSRLSLGDELSLIQVIYLRFGQYYLDIRKTDINGHLNDSDYFSGELASGQIVTNIVQKTDEVVPEINGTLSISNFVLNKKDKGLFNVGIVFGGRVKPIQNKKITMTDKFVFTIGGVSGYKFEVPFSNFKVTKLLGKKIRTYLTKEVKIVLLESGDFEVLINKSNLQSVNAEKAGIIRIDIDSTSANAKITLKCNKNICVKAGK